MCERDAFLRLSREDQRRIRWAVLQGERFEDPQLRAGLRRFLVQWRRQSLILVLVAFPVFSSALIFVLDAVGGGGSAFRSQVVMIAVLPLCAIGAIGVVWWGRRVERANREEDPTCG